MYKSLLIFTLPILLFGNVVAQIMPKGKYVGYEPMMVYKEDTTFSFPGIYHVKEMDSSKSIYHSKVWFHEVTVNIKSDKNINISKIPVYFKNGVKFYSDSLGGFFYYNNLALKHYSLNAQDSTIRGKPCIIGVLTKKLKGSRINSDAVPRYVMINYNILKYDEMHLVMETTYGVLEYKRK